MSAPSRNSSTGEWKVGDRIVIHGLKQAQHLNGRHGFIGGEPDEQTGRLPVDFDLVDPSVGRVMVQPANLKREVTIMDDGRQLVGKESGSSSSQAKSDTKICVDPLHKSGVENGILVEEEGRPLSLILDAIRFMAGSVLFQDPNIQTGLQDVEQLRNQGPRGLLKINQFMGAAWTHWNDKGPYDTPGNKTMYELLLQFFEELPSANGCNMSDMPLEFRKAKEALHHLTAVRGWRVRIHGDFWIVGADKIDGGTMLVSNINRSAVYKVFGIRNSLFHMVDPTYGMRPVLMKLTMIPWYGRLVYDGVVMPSKNGESPDIADDELAKKLRKNVKLAKLEKRVVEKLAELECLDAEGSVPMPSTSGDRIDEGSQLISKTTKEPTPLEKELLEKLAKCQISDDMESAWCMRRMGYTGLENPSHRGMIITGNGAPLVSFTCRALVPEPADIFVALMDGSSAVDGKLPAVVLVDDLKCSKRVEYLLRQHTEVDNALHQIKVYYYPPPTSEETAAALLQK